MKNVLFIMVTAIIFSLASCQTRVVSTEKPFKKDSLELYKKYTFQLQDASVIKMEVLRVDNQNVYGKDKDGQSIVIGQKDIREAKKMDVISSIAVGLAAVAAVIFVPI